MNLSSFFHNPLHVLGAAAAVGAVAVIVAALPPRSAVEPAPDALPQLMAAPDADRLNERIPAVGSVLEKHLFVPSREATGQNSFPDLVVKGVFLGKEKSAVFSLKSKPQANLRVWLGEVESTLNSVTDPRDPRQSLVTFLREWPIKDISPAGVSVEHFITGEVETYEVDYVAAKKVKDDAQRGYGQGIMPQGTATAAAGNNAQKKAQAGTRQTGTAQASGAAAGAQFMADRVSKMLQQMNPQQQMQFMQRFSQQSGGGQNQNSTKNQNTGNSKNSTKKKTKK
jgi:hypothetical protein